MTTPNPTSNLPRPHPLLARYLFGEGATAGAGRPRAPSPSGRAGSRRGWSAPPQVSRRRYRRSKNAWRKFLSHFPPSALGGHPRATSGPGKKSRQCSSCSPNQTDTPRMARLPSAMTPPETSAAGLPRTPRDGGCWGNFAHRASGNLSWPGGGRHACGGQRTRNL